MKNLQVFEPLTMEGVRYKNLRISVGYDLGGYNYFSSSQNRRGIYCYLVPCSIGENGLMESTLMGDRRESGYKVFLEELPRRNQKKIDAWVAKITPLTAGIAKLYAESKNHQIIELLTGKSTPKNVFLKADGTVSEIKPANGKTFDLEEMQKLVGGLIEIIDLKDGRCLVVNEEGKLTGLPRNDKATGLWEESFGLSDVIVGNAIVCESVFIK